MDRPSGRAVTHIRMNLCNEVSWMVGQTATEVACMCNRFRREKKEKDSANSGDLPCYRQRLTEMKGEFLRQQLGPCSPAPGLCLALGSMFQCCKGEVSFLLDTVCTA